MTWNYRILRQKSPSGEDWYAIHEVYYDDDGKTSAWTQDAQEPCGESVEELLDNLKRMLADAEKAKDDVIDYDSKPEGKSLDDGFEEDLKKALDAGEITQEEYDDMMNPDIETEKEA